MDTQEEQGRTLLLQIADGSEIALEEFYRRYESRIYAFVLSRLNNVHAAGDILNEVMWAIWCGAGKFKGQSKIVTWIFGIAHHKILDYFRAQGRHEAEDLDPDIPEISDRDVVSKMERFQDSEHIRHALGELDEKHRQVLHLAFFEDLSGKEISEIFGCPEATVRTRIHYAKKALKQQLAKDLEQRTPIQ